MIERVGLGDGLRVGPADLQPSRAAGAAQSAAGADFSSMLAGLAEDAVRSVGAAEKAAVGGIRGEVPLNQVVDKVLEAERTLQSAIAVRDKVVAAYLELTRMQI